MSDQVLKYELDFNIYNFENCLHLNSGVSTKITCRISCSVKHKGIIRIEQCLDQQKLQYLPHN